MMNIYDYAIGRKLLRAAKHLSHPTTSASEARAMVDAQNILLATAKAIGENIQRYENEAEQAGVLYGWGV